MFKKLKEFFFGTSAKENNEKAPYKVEMPIPLVLPLEVVAAAPIAEVTKVNSTRKPRTTKVVEVVAIKGKTSKSVPAITATKKLKKS